MDFSALNVTKLAVSAVVGSGTSKIVAAIIKNNVSPEKLTDKVAIAGATFAFGAMAAAKTKEFTDAQIDEAHEFYLEHIKPKFQK